MNLGTPKQTLRRKLQLAASYTLATKATLLYELPHAKALYGDPGSTLDDIREAVTTLEDTQRIARHVLGSAHPATEGIEDALRNARAALRVRERV